MYTALYRACRPEVFGEILGQEHIVKILSNQLDTGSTSHAYLFCGTRGTGKTTTARILAKGLNCLSEEKGRPCGHCKACRSIQHGTFMDVIEIDAASNNGVDNIRELRESVKYPPAAGRRKVYIIDEVHMLSQGAFNALLKTLEEPPEYVVFILATTEPQKLPATILSRCMRLDFRRVPEKILTAGMADICAERGIRVSDDALRIIAANADGSVRDGLSILDQCLSGGENDITAAQVLEFLGASGEETFVELTDHVRRGSTADALLLIDSALSDGKDVRQFLKDWINHYRNLLMAKFIRDPEKVIDMSVENIDRIRKQSSSIELADINRGILELSKTMREARWSTQPRILLELAAVNLSAELETPQPVQRKAPEDRQPAVRRSMPAPEEHHEQPPQRERRPQPQRGAEPGHSRDTARTGPAEEKEKKEPAPDLEKIWRAVSTEAEHARGSCYIIASGAVLTDISEYAFTLTASSEHVKRIAENSRDLLESIMEKHTGAKRRMNVEMKGSEPEEDGIPIGERLTKDLNDMGYTDIEIR